MESKKDKIERYLENLSDNTKKDKIEVDSGELVDITYNESIDGGFVGYVNDVLGAVSQGETVEELKENLKDSLRVLDEFNEYKSKK